MGTHQTEPRSCGAYLRATSIAGDDATPSQNFIYHSQCPQSDLTQSERLVSLHRPCLMLASGFDLCDDRLERVRK